VHWFLGDDEFFVDMDDPAAIAQSIKRARGSASAGRDRRVKTASAFSWEKIAGRYRNFFQEIIARTAYSAGG
jgi:uncharacterized alpha-E superfamily protein